MYATIFCAMNINQLNGDSMNIQGLNNTFAIPFSPTLFAIDISAVIAGMDRKIENNLKIFLNDESNNRSLVVDFNIPIDSEALHYSTLTFSSSARNVKIMTFGEHKLSVHINDEEIGNTKLFFIKE